MTTTDQRAHGAGVPAGTGLVALKDGVQAVQVPFWPGPVGRRFLDDTTLVTGLFGPLGTAKTTLLCMKAYRYAQAFPGAKIAIVRDTWPNLRDTTMQSWLTWFPVGLCGELHKTTKTFMLRTAGPPSQILFRALDDERDVRNVLSLELAAAALDEPQGGPNTKGGSDPGIDETLYRSLLGRVGRQAGYPLKMLWMVGNPPAPSHWIAKEFRYDGEGQPRNPHPKRCLFLVDQGENRANLHPTYYEDLIDLWGRDTPLARRFIFGEWVEFATTQPFHRDWVRYWGTADEPEPDRSELVIDAGVDPAISKSDRAARTAIVVAGQRRRGPDRGRIYVLHSEAGHWSVLQQVERILAAVRQWNVRNCADRRCGLSEGARRCLGPGGAHRWGRRRRRAGEAGRRQAPTVAGVVAARRRRYGPVRTRSEKPRGRDARRSRRSVAVGPRRRRRPLPAGIPEDSAGVEPAPRRRAEHASACR
jgi:hypothetical protein